MKAKKITVGAVGLCSVLSAVYAVSGPAKAAEAVAAAGSETRLEEVIVTAQRRSERLQDVPISVTALSADTLSKAGVTSTIDLGKMSAGVVVPQYGAYTVPAIRGISSEIASAGDSTNVAIYLDGVYQPFILPQLAELPDVQSIQILKGPQGSLYGQNAAGGAIVVDTVTPTSTFHGKGTISYGNYNNKSAQGYVTGPITQNLEFAIAGAVHDHDGFNHDLLRGGHDVGLRSHQFRAKLLFKPTDDISLTLQGYSTKRSDSTPYSGQPFNNNSSGTGFRNFLFPNLPLPTAPHQFSQNIPPEVNIRTAGVSLLGKFKVGELGSFNTVTAYQSEHSLFQLDVDASPVNIVDFTDIDAGHAFIQEANFVSNKFDRFTVTAGGFFMKTTDGYFPAPTYVYTTGFGNASAYPNHPAPTVVLGSTSKTKKTSFAVYGEVGFDITDQLTLTAGGRFSDEKILAFNTLLPAGWDFTKPYTAAAPDPRGSFTFKKFTPRAVLRYKPADNATLYASYSEGFKSGYVGTSKINACGTPGTDSAKTCIDAVVQPENVKAFEVGYKGAPTDWLNISVAAFHYIYKNIQVFIYTPAGTGFYQNAAAARINGAEFEAQARVSPDLTASVNAAYLDGKYTSYTNAAVFVPTAFGGNAQTTKDVSGYRLIRTPKLTANASLNYTHAFEPGTVGAYTNVSYSSNNSLEASGRIHQPRYALIDGELSFSPAAIQGLKVAVWGKNLTNKNFLQSTLLSTLVDYAAYGDPRTFGLKLDYAF